MGRYILTSDYDGTLVQNKKITEETILAINKFRSMGNLFGIVTGRDFVEYSGRNCAV